MAKTNSAQQKRKIEISNQNTKKNATFVPAFALLDAYPRKFGIFPRRPEQRCPHQSDFFKLFFGSSGI
jgi:hypothetical protein